MELINDTLTGDTACGIIEVTTKQTHSPMDRRRYTHMSKIYDAQGNKMNLAGICGELQEIMTVEQKEMLAKACDKYEFDNSQMKLAHGILDTYRLIDSTREKGMRVRKLMDNLMTKYQKATPANADDQVVYRNLISSIHE